MIKKLFILFLIIARASGIAAAQQKTSFQTAGPWEPGLHLPIDIAIVYSVNPDVISSWSDRGYTTWVMTGASWLDKNTPVVENNPGISQTTRDGKAFEMIPGRAWVVPVAPWIEYISSFADKAAAAGATGFLPEEPEFFAVTGYSDMFKSEWRKFYGSEWAAPHSSAENNWKANKLKSHLFANFYKEVFARAKAVSPGMKTIIPAHSNINYADWQIVAPHHAFSALDNADGFIAQVWTGTAKHPHFLGGAPVADTFAYAAMEYEYFAGLVEGTDKQLWMLTDPVEDAPGASWSSLRRWYEETLVGTLLQPASDLYECLPWPNRVFLDDKTYGGSAIPQEYASELLSVWTAQKRIERGGEWQEPVSRDIAFLTSDTLMWQRSFGAERFQGFLAPMLASVRSGILPRLLPVERFAESGFPSSDINTIVASFDAWKPENESYADGLAQWVLNGGDLFLIGGLDEYNDMSESWWRKKGFDSPLEALFSKLGVNIEKKKYFETDRKLAATAGPVQIAAPKKAIEPASGMALPDGLKTGLSAPLPIAAFQVAGAKTLFNVGPAPLVWEVAAGKGRLLYAGFPGEFVSSQNAGPEIFLALLNRFVEGDGGRILRPDAFVRRSGEFIVARGVADSYQLAGQYLDILNPSVAPLNGLTLKTGDNAFLMDINLAKQKCGAAPACVLHSGSFLENEFYSKASNQFKFKTPGSKDRFSYAWIYLPAASAPNAISKGVESEWFADMKLLKLKIPLQPDGVDIVISL